MSSGNLSQSDQRILTSVFDPENSPDSPAAKIDPSLPEDAQIRDPELLASLRRQELQAIRLVEQHSTESSAVPKLWQSAGQDASGHASEQDSKRQVYEQSHSILSDIINLHPAYASAYNNRAQLCRWYHGDNLLSIEAFRSQDRQVIDRLDTVFADLEAAIKLASPRSGAGGSSSESVHNGQRTSTAPASAVVVSPAQGKLLAQVWMQRGAILWGLAKALQKDKGTEGGPVDQQYHTSSVPKWRAWDAAQLEEEGSRSFYMAGLYGSEVGRAMAVKTNPYARLCAGIVKEAMAGEYGAYTRQ